MCRRADRLLAPDRSTPAFTRWRWVYLSYSTENRSTKWGRSGRGPTKVMSPRKMFHNCGSSSKDVRRRIRPLGHSLVVRDRPAGRGLRGARRAHRPELEESKTSPFRPTLLCRNITLGPSSIRTATAHTASSGSSSTISTPEPTTSNAASRAAGDRSNWASGCA